MRTSRGRGGRGERNSPLPDLKEGDSASRKEARRRPALHPAPRPLHRGDADPGHGGKGHWPPLHLRAHHLHHPGPRVRGQGGQGPAPHAAGRGGHRAHDRASSPISSTSTLPPIWKVSWTRWKRARSTGRMCSAGFYSGFCRPSWLRREKDLDGERIKVPRGGLR